MENVLDEYSKQPLSKELYESIEWWEKRRIYFNILVGFPGLFTMLSVWRAVEIIGFIPSFIGIIIYGTFLNFCYCFGWGIDILKSFYLKNPSFGKHKYILLILGIILSMYVTSVIAFDTLILSVNESFPF